ncbi:N-acetylmuramoyl-L-alanine amidase, partial [Bacteroides thetaiotaomicron]|nr:N-acetylmuramoyl-L-alanine amidase [Bacteroides thetaiotaomicron]MBV4377628.1 N-acetylmuramoyl-L-alanine amidase [Bacteroides thetaiotaomicron]MBV4383098.1 N-acetylmuramoyl-L-alanine amidase [Bacteroides thetaiotaomicron]
MRTITLIIIHCSATPEGKALSAEACRQDHIRHRGFRDIGYHFYI